MAGRPSKFTADLQKQIRFLAEKGFTEYEMAKALGLHQSSITNWKKKNPGFFAALNDWKAVADARVERSLYDRAKGYSHPETKAQWIHDDDGGRWEYAEMTRHYPPDPTSMIFWLKNRKRLEWRDKIDHEHDHRGKINLLSEVPEPDAKPDETD